MKKISLLLLVIALVCGLFVLTSCGGNNNTDTDSGSTNTDTGSQPQPDEDLQAAYDYVKLTYKTLNVTTSSFEVMKNAPIGDRIFNISWSTDNDAITITESEDGSFYVVNIPELGDDAINYTLKFSVENEKGEKKMGSFNLTVPAFSVNTHDQYVDAADGEALIVQGIVTGIMAKTHNTSTKEESLYLQDLSGNGGYYVYNAKTDLTNIRVGMTVEVRGEKKNYNGTFELINADVIVIDETINTVTPVDFTAAVLGADSLEAEELTRLNGMLVTIKGVTLLTYSEANGYHNFEIGEHKTYFRISTSSNCITEDDGRTLTSTFESNFYNAADVTGIVAVYNGAIYLMPVSKDALTNVVAQEKPDDVQVDIALENTSVPGLIQLAGNTSLPTTFASLTGVSISWELVDGAGVATLNGATLTVTIPEEAKTVKVTATVTSGEVSKTKDYEIVVKPISTITIQEALNIGDVMASGKYTEELYYIVGTIDNIANDVYGNLYIVDGDFDLYIYGLYDSTGKVRYDSMDPKPLVKDTIKVLSTVGKYSTTVQLKNAKVVEHTIHPDNVGEAGVEVPFNPSNPIVGSEFFFGMLKNEKVYYITGVMSGYYMATTSTQADSVKVTVAEGPSGTYYLTVNIDGATKYLDLVLSGTHKNAVFADAAPAVGFSFDSEYKVFYKELDGSNYTFGTGLANNYFTVGGVRVGADNAMCQISSTAPHTHEYEDVVTAPTCEAEGYTTHTCKTCGDVVVDTKVDALGHKYVEGACTVCGATEHEHTYNEVVTAPTCYQAGYTTYTCTVPGCGKSYTGNEVAATGAHADNNGDYKCDTEGCTEVFIPAADSTLTVEQAIALGGTFAHNTYTTGKYYVTGKITEIYNTTYGNMKITVDDTVILTVYGTYSADGSVRFDSMPVKPVVGETITVYGIIGQYNGTPQMKNGWITEQAPHECVAGAEATCTTAQKCTVCDKVLVEALGHAFGDDGKCTRCGFDKNAEATNKELAKFEFGANGSATHVDGNDLGATKSYTEGNYTLTLEGMSKVYGPAFDAKGNSAIKLGTSKLNGTFSFTVADDVNKVVIMVAQYKANSTKVSVNGVEYTISTASNSGEYTAIEIDTTTTKTITFATVGTTYRAMVDSITFIG